MGTYDKRMIRITQSPVPKIEFFVTSFNGSEGISQLFSFDIKMVTDSPGGDKIIFEQVAGKSITVSIRTHYKKERHFNGIIIAFSQELKNENEGYSTYNAVMMPTFWLHTEYYDCRIFQDKTVENIIDDVLKIKSPQGVDLPELQFEKDLKGSLQVRDFCVQYNESNYNFISRLCEEEGIFFYFKHDENKHTLVFTNDNTKYEPFPKSENAGVVDFAKTGGAMQNEEVVTFFQRNKKLATRYFSIADHYFSLSDAERSASSVTTQGEAANMGETYEYPGGHKETPTTGIPITQIRMQAQDTKMFNIRGRSNCRGFTPGYKFKLIEHPIEDLKDKEYLLTSVNHQGTQRLSTESGSGDNYLNLFQCLSVEVPYRPIRKTKKPQILSSQTAFVTGQKGEEIETDKYGRVKVRFHWDRRDQGPLNGHTSCWIRVAQIWAGDQWGAMNIPRVGQEVIVNFLDGDPDRPIITGRVYNANSMPPYALPLKKTVSTIKSNSSKGGNNFNEIRFEDLKGSEEFYTHAAKDQNEEVENHMTTKVGNNQTVTVENDRAVTISSGNETYTIQSGSRSVSVKSNETHTNSANFDHSVSGNYTLKVSGNINIEAGGTVKISGSKIILNG
jgi:type VI secretion system secreted protein VgrG